MKVLVTGANSLLGTNTIVELLKNGYSVRAMTRKYRAIQLSDSRMEQYTGEITQRTDVNEAAEGCDIIIHIAANTDQNSIRYEDYASVNVQGTKNILNAAKKHQVRRTIIVSSANTFGYGSKENPGTEEKPFRYPFTESGYACSKYEAQKLALDFPKEGMGDILVVNPTFMIGPYDSKPSSGKIILMGNKKQFVFVPPGGKNFVHVKDVANAIVKAIQFGKDRECYLLCNENLSYKSFYQKLSMVTGYKSQIIIIPRWLLLAAGLFGSCVIRLGIKTSLHYNNMRMLCINNYYNNEKAVKEMQLNSTPVLEAISDAIEWFQNNGMLKKESSSVL